MVEKIQQHVVCNIEDGNLVGKNVRFICFKNDRQRRSLVKCIRQCDLPDLRNKRVYFSGFLSTTEDS